MGIDPNDVSIDWSTLNTDSNINVIPQSINAETPETLITSCNESQNPLLSHGMYIENIISPKTK